jgi:hypothetical protein
MRVLALVPALDPLLAADGEHVVVELDFNLIRSDARHLDPDTYLVLRLSHIHLRHQEVAHARRSGIRKRRRAEAAEHIVKQAIHLSLEGEHGVADEAALDPAAGAVGGL